MSSPFGWFPLRALYEHSGVSGRGKQCQAVGSLRGGWPSSSERERARGRTPREGSSGQPDRGGSHTAGYLEVPTSLGAAVEYEDGGSRSWVHRILRQQMWLYPYKLLLVQRLHRLHGGDSAKRLRFCRRILGKWRSPLFRQFLLFLTDGTKPIFI